jgi:hypothetical protein
MTSDGIFLRSVDGLSMLTDQPYDSENILQEALAIYPEVIAGSTTGGQRDARLLLVRREMGVPSQESGSATFSLDHLFIDSECVPVLVEVKRSSDTRIRREVVGQMLDYAANGVRYWPAEVLQQSLELEASSRGLTSEQLLAGHCPGLAAETFWANVQANLAAGRIRLLFVADALPPELCRVIEFLNEQMSPAEVLGVELRQYVGDGHIVYVPRVIGQTATAAAAKSPASTTAWTEGSFLEAASGRCSVEEMALIQRLLDDPATKGGRLSWGKGATPGVGGWYPINGIPTSLWVLNANNESPSTQAYLMFYFADIAKKHGLDVVERAASRLETIPALKPKIHEARAVGWAKWPSVYLPDVVRDPNHAHAIFDAIAAIADRTAP